MIQIDVTIMGQIYTLSCKEEQQIALREAAHYLDNKKCAIRSTGKILGNDRIAVMAGLSIAKDLLAMQAAPNAISEIEITGVRKKIAAIHQVLDMALLQANE